MYTNAEESIDFQPHRSKAMLLESVEDCTQLYQSLEDDQYPNYRGWDDNGGDPDGFSWLIWPCDDTLIACADRAGVPYTVVDGYELPYPLELSQAFAQGRLDLDGAWSGVSASACAFVVSESDTAKFMRAASASERER